MKASLTVRHASLGTLLVTLVLLLSSAKGFAQDPAIAKYLETCRDCHGIDGLGFKSDIPHLNGQLEPLLRGMLDAYRQGQRSTKVKYHRELGATEAALLAKHYAEQKAERPKQQARTELLARGQALYAERCADCHLDNGRESDKEAPLLAGQNLDYLLQQTLAFKAGERKFPFMMDKAYRNLGDEDLTAVAHFFAAQEATAPKKARRRR